jgi:hypothetical protein
MPVRIHINGGGPRRGRTAALPAPLPRRPTAAFIALVLLAVFTAACGGGSSAPKHTGKGTSSTTTTTTSSSAKTQTMTVRPSSGLHTGSAVRVSAKGFSPSESLIVIECANKGKGTSVGDCNFTGAKYVKSNSSGEVNTTYRVTKGPFGSKHIVCKSAGSCILSVTQASPSPTQDATAPLDFT